MVLPPILAFLASTRSETEARHLQGTSGRNQRGTSTHWTKHVATTWFSQHSLLSPPNINPPPSPGEESSGERVEMHVNM